MDTILKLKNIAKSFYDDSMLYHNWNHVESCVDFAKQFSCYNNDIKLALYFHDCIYEIGSINNENKSATIACNIISELMDASTAIRVSNLIFKTKHKNETLAFEDEQVVCDSDLSILAADKDDYYFKYALLIQQEYCLKAKIPVKNFIEGRIFFLNGMLAKKNIFHHAKSKKYESIARKNITNELGFLQNEHRVYYGS